MQLSCQNADKERTVNMRIGICQTDVIFEDKKYNLIAAEDYISECKDKEVDLILFPEMSMTGFSMNTEKIYEVADDEAGIIAVMKRYAYDYDVAIGFGYVLLKDGKYTNRYMIIDSQKNVLCDYAKIHPFSYAGESEKYESGDSIADCELAGVHITPFICYDLRFPEIFQAASVQSELIIVAANWPAQRISQWKVLLQARAIENQTYVIGVNRFGSDPENQYSGCSMIVSPQGDILDMINNRAGIMIADVETHEVNDYRSWFSIKEDRKPELYKKLL